MRPVLTPDELRAADQRALGSTTIDALIARAGTALSYVAKSMLPSLYGARIVIVCGPGNNGEDGAVAASILTRLGAMCSVVRAATGIVLPPCDLVIDAAFGTGFRSDYEAPMLTGSPLVLACDLPSGLDAITGEPHGAVLTPDVTATFVATKPGLILAAPSGRVGKVVVCDLGIDPGIASIVELEPSDLRPCFELDASAHKWKTAVTIVAGSPHMAGAAALCARGAQRAGAGMVRLVTSATHLEGAVEAVRVTLPERDWLRAVSPSLERSRALVIGPGLGRSAQITAEVAALVAQTTLPVVIDADGLSAFANAAALRTAFTARPRGSVVLTPHDGEYASLVGTRPGPDRFAAARTLAELTGAVVLLKGPVTVVASPEVNDTYAITSAPPTLATAGTGDVLSGIIAALLARFPDRPASWAAAHGAQWHASAAQDGAPVGLVASDLPALLPAVARAIGKGAQ